MNDKCGLLVNSSRGIIFASSGDDFAKKASEKALELQKQMEPVVVVVTTVNREHVPHSLVAMESKVRVKLVTTEEVMVILMLVSQIVL